MHKKGVVGVVQGVRKFLIIYVMLDLLPKIWYYYNTKIRKSGNKKEKIMKTKILSVLLAMVLVLALFASCDGDGGNGTTPGGTTPGGTTPGGTTPSEPEVAIPEGAPSYDVTWNKTELKYALTDSSNKDELSSGCRKYYSGTASGANETIDTLVKARNDQAAKAANVLPRYDYETATRDWGGNIDIIISKATSGSDEAPDIYCNFVYDLTCAQLRGCFANLLDTTSAKNNFRFNETGYEYESDNYFDAEKGEGYFFQYMKSLTLSDDKMYVLASNYCTDLVRAFLVVPLNIEMMSGITVEDSYTGEMANVGDFYKLVWREMGEEKYDGGWTYDVLAHYADKVSQSANAGSGNALSGTVGFAAGCTSGLVSSGFLYTTSVKIIEKKAENGSYTYSYPEDNDDLDALASALFNLFGTNKNGIVTVITDEVKEYGSTDLIAIRNRFSQNGILFGGIIALGSLEDTVYQNMRTTGSKLGFGVLPVPLYRAADENGVKEEYLTLVHNLARVVAISKTTKNFTQCTAYLDYLSRMSQDVLDEYYEGQLASAVAGNQGANNVRMLTYIRNHVRDCFDKTFEDAVSNYLSATNDDVNATKWHIILKDSRFQMDNFSGQYDANAGNKEEQLESVVDDWNSYN